jgi:hypothetical protein
MTTVCSESPDLVGDALEEALPVAEALSGQADSLASALGSHPPLYIFILADLESNGCSLPISRD